MTELRQTASHPTDISLLLRVYGEQRWLLDKVFPVLREAEQTGAIDEQELPTALAYLEVLWSQACRLASQTDMAAALLETEDPPDSEALVEKAQRYHAAISRLRSATRARVERVTAPVGPPLPHEHARR